MDMQAIREAATAQGARPEALEDVERRAQQAFHTPPDPGVLDLWLTQLAEKAQHLFRREPTGQPWEQLGIPQAVWDHLSPAEKLSRGRQMQPQPQARPRRPERYTATPEQLRSIEGLSLAERMTAYRQWQADATPRQQQR